MWLAIFSSLFQLMLAAGGIYVSLRPVRVEHHYWWIIGFAFVGLIGVAMTGIQAYSTDQKEQTLQAQIGQLLQQSRDAEAGIQKLQKTAEETYAKPKMVGHIEQVARKKDDEHGGTQLLILMTITNTGTPSVVRGFPLTIQNDSLDRKHVMATAFPESFPIRDEKGKILSELTSNDALYEKTIKPIERGAFVIGRLLYLLNDININEFKPGTKLTVGFSDAFGNTYEASYQMTGESSSSQKYYYPGAKTFGTPQSSK